MNVIDWVKENADKLISIIDLEDVQSKSDSCEQPYKSQYVARDILQGCITDLHSKIQNNLIIDDSNSNFVYLYLSYRLANNFIGTEERHLGEEIINELCEKMENISHLKLFLEKLADKATPIGDVMKGNSDETNVQLSETGENFISEVDYIRKLSDIIIKIYNTVGMLWASRIMSGLGQDMFEDTGVQNSIKYLGRAKCLYKKYRYIMRNKEKECTFKSKVEFYQNFEPPECVDSFLLQHIGFCTPYLKNECNIEQQNREESVKFDVFESDFTTTLFLLAQTYGKLSSHSYFKHKSAKYCYWTLSRQLNALKYDPVEWAINAATLSQYFVSEKRFKRARHCIAAAEIIIKEAKQRPTEGPKSDSNKKESTSNKMEETTTKEKKSETSELDCNKTVDGIFEEAVDKLVDDMCFNKISKESLCKDKVNQSNCSKKKLLPDPMSVSRMWDDDVYEEKREQGEVDIDRCWVNYGNTLLEISSERLLPSYDIKSEEAFDKAESDMEDFNLEVSHVEKQVTSDWLTNFDEAREVFLFVQKKIVSAKKYYRIDFRCSDYIELVMDHSKLFKGISNFEYSVERKCCMFKKRIDMLSELLEMLNQDYYLIACRKMMLEIGEIYNTMMILKTSNLENDMKDENAKTSAKYKPQVQKIKKLATNGLKVYDRFLESYRSKTGIMPELFSEDDIRPILISHFYMARMFNKVIEPDKKLRLNNLHQSLYHYKYIVDYCEKHEIAKTIMAPELDSCRDMAVLLPCKIDKMVANIT